MVSKKVENEIKSKIFAYILCQNDKSITYYVPAFIWYLIFFRDYVDPISLWVSICDIVTPNLAKNLRLHS